MARSNSAVTLGHTAMQTVVSAVRLRSERIHPARHGAIPLVDGPSADPSFINQTPHQCDLPTRLQISPRLRLLRWSSLETSVPHAASFRPRCFLPPTIPMERHRAHHRFGTKVHGVSLPPPGP
jgi:hypothetical protein